MRGNPSELLDPVEETLDEISVLVPVSVILLLYDAVLSRREVTSVPSARTFMMKLSYHSPVRDHPLGALEALKQGFGLRAVGFFQGSAASAPGFLGTSAAACTFVFRLPESGQWPAGRYFLRTRAMLVNTNH